MDLYSLFFLSICYWWFFYDFLLSMFGEYNIYGRVDDGFRGDFFFIGVVVVRFFIEFIKNFFIDNDR